MRYADDIVAGFEYQADAKRFQAELRDRLARFALTLHPDKTRLIQFGRRRSGSGQTFEDLALHRRSQPLYALQPIFARGGLERSEVGNAELPTVSGRRAAPLRFHYCNDINAGSPGS